MTTRLNGLLSWLQLRALLVFLGATALVAWPGSVMTRDSVDSEWFTTLEKPVFYPPDATFGIVWTILYALVALAEWRATAGPRPSSSSLTSYGSDSPASSTGPSSP